MHPFFKEFFGSVVNGSGTCKNLSVTRPTKTLVTLVTVRGNIKEVAPLTPDYIFIKLLYKLVTASKVARTLHIGKYNDRNKICGVNFIFVKALKLNVAKALICKMGLVGMLVAVGNNLDFNLGITHIIKIEVAVSVKNLCMVKSEFLTLFGRYLPLNVAC